MAYLVVADLRPGTRLFAGLEIATTDASDSRVTTSIAEVSAEVDRECSDHFEPENAKTFDVQSAAGGAYLFLPRRPRVVTSVNLIAPDDTVTLVEADKYRVHSSLAGNFEDDFDALELTSPTSGPERDGGWPRPPWLVRVLGDWNWSTTPEAIKLATALEVYVRLKRSEIPPQAVEWIAKNVRFKANVKGPFRAAEVGGIIRPYSRMTDAPVVAAGGHAPGSGLGSRWP